MQGQVQLPALKEPPRYLRELLCGIDPLSKTFKDNIRQYNAAFAFTSLGVKIDQAITNAPGPYSFRISGELHHHHGALIPEQAGQECYAQIYIHDEEEQRGIHLRRNPNLNPTIMTNLQAMLHENHPYVLLYKYAHQIMMEQPLEHRQTVRARLRADVAQDRNRYNLPTADEVSVIIPGDGSEEVSEHRDVIVRLHGGALHRISHLNPAYSPLHYTLLFPHGDHGWHKDIPSHPGPMGQIRSQNVSQRCYYAYRLHYRPGIQPALFRGGKLLQQYIVDAWASTEQSNLNWVRTHQKQLRADVYQGLRDLARGDRAENMDLANHGQRIILPSTHIGSERHMLQLFQDSMAICREFRKPDLFITMTANPNWPEITAALL